MVCKMFCYVSMKLPYFLFSCNHRFWNMLQHGRVDRSSSTYLSIPKLTGGGYIPAGESRTVIILPLIERELRVRSRRLAVYWLRFATALTGILICVPTLFSSASP